MKARTKILLASVLTALLAAVVYFSWPITEPATEKAVATVDWSKAEDRTAKKGEHQFRPGYGWQIQRRRPGWTLEVQFDSAAWYDPTTIGKDGDDWSKLGGVSYFNWWQPSSWAFNHYAALGAFKCLREPYTFGFAGYTNLRDGSFRYGEIVQARAGERVRIDYDYFNGVAVYEIWVSDTGYYQQVLPIDVARTQIAVPAWHGGQKPAPINFTFKSVLKLK